MKKDWLKDIHDRMTDLEVDAPHGLWDDICTAEKEQEEVPMAGNIRQTNKVWIESAAAVAACMLLVWYVRPSHVPESDSPASTTEPIVQTEQAPHIESHWLPEKEATRYHPSVIASATEKVEPTLMTPAATIDSDSASTVRHDEDSSVTPLPIINERKREPQKGHEMLAEVHRSKSKRETRLSIALSSSGGIGSDNRQLYSGSYQGTSTMLCESEWVDSPLLGIMAMNRGAETERKISHHAPIRTGLAFSYRLNDRWSIESGLTYALVSSDIREGSTSNYIEEEQTLHYIGIPAGVTYRVASWKRLDLYLSTNLLAEQCVAGQARKRFFIGDRAQGEDAVETIQSHPMQWSVGAKAGIQYNLNSLLSVYAEPGCSYYLDDRSTLETVFKDKVFDFNMNLGLRFTIGE